MFCTLSAVRYEIQLEKANLFYSDHWNYLQIKFSTSQEVLALDLLSSHYLESFFLIFNLLEQIIVVSHTDQHHTRGFILSHNACIANPTLCEKFNQANISTLL